MCARLVTGAVDYEHRALEVRDEFGGRGAVRERRRGTGSRTRRRRPRTRASAAEIAWCTVLRRRTRSSRAGRCRRRSGSGGYPTADRITPRPRRPLLRWPYVCHSGATTTKPAAGILVNHRPVARPESVEGMQEDEPRMPASGGRHHDVCGVRPPFGRQRGRDPGDGAGACVPPGPVVSTEVAFACRTGRAAGGQDGEDERSGEKRRELLCHGTLPRADRHMGGKIVSLSDRGRFPGGYPPVGVRSRHGDAESWKCLKDRMSIWPNTVLSCNLDSLRF